MAGGCSHKSWGSSPPEKGSYYAAQAALKLMILLPQSPQCWDYSCTSALLEVCFLCGEVALVYGGDSDSGSHCVVCGSYYQAIVCKKPFFCNFLVLLTFLLGQMTPF
jgi:hypothetical protein